MLKNLIAQDDRLYMQKIKFSFRYVWLQQINKY